MLGMPQSHVVRVRRLVEPLECLLADRVEHAEAAAAPPPHEALHDERLEDVELGVANGLRRAEREAAGEHRQPLEELLLVRPEQLVAPLDRRAQRALACRGVARLAGEERQAPLEPGKKLLPRQISPTVGVGWNAAVTALARSTNRTSASASPSGSNG
jgi:hypothetical protein